MNTKLTLTIEKNVIEKAKMYARLSGRSLSDLVESYLKELTSNKADLEEEIPDEFKGLFGVVDLPASMDDKATIRSLMIEKHKK
ncbi:MAG: DUF6364 family protein [Saprospiraceae bacterium]|nr:hypothetical protein [Lewinella sp.]